MARARRIVRGVAQAPATFGWLLVLLVTTRVQRSAGHQRAQLLHSQSTNLHHLSNEPTRVLTASLFWLDGRRWWPYVLPYVAVLAPAERRLGTWRWSAVGLAAHVTGTYIGQGYLRWSISRDKAPPRLANARDVGVSYFLFGVAGMLSAYVPRRYRWACRGAAVTALTANVVIRPTFTEVGHLSAYLTGLALCPLAPDAQRRPYPGTHGYAQF
ncbi:rhomboid-like protein [Mycobacterium sp. WMMD1722]|uniref:rhomboid-like protein n=1 Tax=Mycobacterium sp. WMMD1722 TaxID=3404117 RepID=UPI003BF4747A